jgi:hypothetical protein
MRTISFILLACMLAISPLKAADITLGAAQLNTTEEVDASANQLIKQKEKDLVSINSRFFMNLAVDITVVLLIIVFIYHPNYRRTDIAFTFIVFNVVIFLLTFVLNKVKISMGAAFGLFAVFSMLRYRTAGISMKDMTYLFVFIAIGLISGIQLEFYEVLLINSLILLIIMLLDTQILIKREQSQSIHYEKIEMIKPQFRTQLTDDLKERTGLNIHRIAISDLDFLKDMALLEVYYYDERKKHKKAFSDPE